jgi:hypothetical protein
MSKRNISLVIAGAVLASAYGSVALGQSQSTLAGPEPVLSFRATGDTMRIRVHTGGCTSAENFSLAVERLSGLAQVTLTRQVPDNCKGNFPEGTEITFSYDAAGLDRADAIRLTNQLVSRPPR